MLISVIELLALLGLLVTPVWFFWGLTWALCMAVLVLLGVVFLLIAIWWLGPQWTWRERQPLGELAMRVSASVVVLVVPLLIWAWRVRNRYQRLQVERQHEAAVQADPCLRAAMQALREDAQRAVAEGVDGIIVSNHGGRTLDGQPATIEVLAHIAAAVQGRVPLLLDGGIRRGTDVFKALALGADAVLVGRPYVYGLAAAGASGVAHVVQLLRAELEVAMALTGCRDLAGINATSLL